MLVCIVLVNECMYVFNGVPCTHLGITEHPFFIPFWDTDLSVICSRVNHKLSCHRVTESLLISCSMSSLVIYDYRLICHPTCLTWGWELELRTPCLTGKHLHTQSFSVPILKVLRIWNTLTLSYSLKASAWKSQKLQQESVILCYYPDIQSLSCFSAMSLWEL